MFEEPQPPLSRAGLTRQEQIRQLAQRCATRKRWRRRGTRLAASLAIVAMVGVWAGRPTRSVPTRPVALRHVAATPTTVTAAPVTSIVTFVGTDAGITDRLSTRPSPPRWVVIDDRQLLDALADAGRPAGLVNMDGHAVLMFRDRPAR